MYIYIAGRRQRGFEGSWEGYHTPSKFTFLMSSNWENSKVRDTYFNEFSVLYTLTIYHSVAKRLVSLTSWHLLQFPTGTSKIQIPSPQTIDISKKNYHNVNYQANT